MVLQDSLYFVFASGTPVTLVYHTGKTNLKRHQTDNITSISEGNTDYERFFTLKRGKIQDDVSDFYWLLFSVFQ